MNKPPKSTIGPEMFRQVKPCDDCPFRKDGGVRHIPEMQASYAAYFLRYPGATFPCHQSVPKDDDRSDWSAWREGQTLCTGGMIFANKLGYMNAVVGAGIENGWLDRSKWQDQDAVFDTIEDYMAASCKKEKVDEMP